MNHPPPQPITRLAPSPTGALHLGNARTFLVNWALARQNGWRIVLRVEDLDTPRVKPGAIGQAIDILAWLGMGWDVGPIVQSDDARAHEGAMRRLAELGLAYPCALTRSQIEAASSAPQEGVHESVFPRELRPGDIGPTAFQDTGTNWRFVVPDGEIRFDDRFAGEQRFEPAGDIGDFVVWTRRAQAAYQLASVVDDARQGITHIVRGDDLLASTARQLLLHRSLSLGPEPAYWHLPLIRGGDGRRLAKRHGDTRLVRYRDLGAAAERVIGLCASWCGLCARREPMDAAAFRDALTLDTIPRRDIVFTPEDEAWLMG